jgi:sugar/nucleoside kinase (ribokinase family)
MHAPAILVVGYLSIDTIETPEARYERVPGGAAMYAALGARQAGARAAIAAAIGEDYPVEWLEALRALAIDVSRVEQRLGATRRAFISHAPSGARASPHHDESGWWERTEALAPRCGDCGGTDAVVAGPVPASTLRAVLSVARAAQAPVIADTSEAFAQRSRDALLACLRDISVFAPSREETRLLVPGYSDDDAALRLAACGPRILQKRGAEGGVAVDGTSLVRIPVARARVVDPTGAGDATVGALAAFLARGDPFGNAAAAAISVGAMAVASVGPAAFGFGAATNECGGRPARRRA